MQILSIHLQDWRGVRDRRVAFGPGVTIVEGPNEIGKSSLLEALELLLSLKASSKRQDVKAVQPVGEDTGSTVTAEIRAGRYRFEYSKTFNRRPQTALRIFEPSPEQLSGDEAHDRVEQILESEVDLALWRALLVRQGDRVEQAEFAEADSLSRALDAAAGGEGSGAEESAVYDLARQEYERYFTSGGKRKASAEAKQLDEAEGARARAQEEFDRVEGLVARHGDLIATRRKLEADLPALEEAFDLAAEAKKELDASREQLKEMERALDDARTETASARDAVTERRSLAEKLRQAQASHETLLEALDPLAGKVAASEAELKKAQAALKAHSRRLRELRQQRDQADGDQRHVEALARIAAIEQRFAKIAAIDAQIETESGLCGAIAVDDAALEVFRELDARHRVLRSQVEATATVLDIVAEADVTFEAGDASLELAAGDSHRHEIARPKVLRLPGVATIRVTPPAAAEDRAQALEDAAKALRTRLAEYGVDSVEEAASLAARRSESEQRLQSLRHRREALLNDASEAALGDERRRLRARTAAFSAGREASEPLPETAALAGERREASEQRLRQAESDTPGLESAVEAARQALDNTRQKLQDGKVESARREEALKSLQARLGEQRATSSDEALDEALRTAVEHEAKIGENTRALAGSVAAADPDSIDFRFANAESAVRNTQQRIIETASKISVLEEQLESGGAAGAWETLEHASVVLEETARLNAATDKRAAAAERLWLTLNRHRDAVREAYVRPLAEAVQRLGRFVFDKDFEVRLNDDWTIDRVTRNGETLPFDSLSIGAKEQIGLLMRLAAAQIAAREGGVPLIIDDALGFADPGRLTAMGTAIAAAGNSGQVIVLSCTPGRFASVGNASLVSI